MTSRIHLKAPNFEDDHARTLQEAAREALRQASVDDAELTLVYTDDQTLRSLNREYRNEDHVTDVLAFPMDETDPESGLNYLGDVVVSVPQAERQATAADHPLQSELALLTIHGVLHLLGHDHADPEAMASMWEAQKRVLANLGLHVGDVDAR